MAYLEEIKALFAQHDIEELIAGAGAPRDEYDDEATEVTQKLMDLEFQKKSVECAVTSRF